MLPEVFDRFKEAAAKSTDVKKGVDALFTAENLQGLPSVFGSLGLLRDEKGKTVFRVESGPLAEVLDRIEERANYGDTASGRFLADEFAKEPFGWDFEVVRLLVLSLLRAGKIEATSKGQTIDSVTGVEARDTFSNNNLFRQASFRPKKGIEFEELVKASEAFRDTFGSEVRELNAGAIVAELRKEVARHEDTVASALATAHRASPAGRRGARRRHRPDEGHPPRLGGQRHRHVQRVASRPSRTPSSARSSSSRRSRNRGFATSSGRGKRSAPLAVPRAGAGSQRRPSSRATELEDLLARETFFRELPAIEQHAGAIETEYERRFEDALEARVAAYTEAFDQLIKTPGWSELQEDAQRSIAAPIQSGMARAPATVPIALLRSERDACEGAPARGSPGSPGAIDGERLAPVSVGAYFAGGIETEEQLDAALTVSARSARASSAPARR